MAGKSLSADIKAYNEKVSSGQKQQATTKYNTPSKQGRTATSYTRQNIADQKSNRAASQQTQAQKGRESAQQKAQQYQQNQQAQTQQREEKSYLNEAQKGRETAELKAQKAQARENAQRYTDEANRLEQEKTGKYGDGIGALYTPEVAEAVGKYDKLIHEQKQKAEQELAKVNTTDKERDSILEQYQAAVENEQSIAGYALDPVSQQAADDARVARENLEDALIKENQRLGNDTYFGLADEARARDRVEGFQGERESLYGAGLGIMADWAGEKTGLEALEKWGEGARESGRNAYAESQQDWENSLEGKSGVSKDLHGVAKSALNVAEDMAVNFLTAGIGGRVLMGLRAAGSGALTQEGREKNDTDSVMAKAMLNMGGALLSNKLAGDLAGAYGKSILGGKFSDMFAGMIKDPNLRRSVTNTEGIDEGIEFGIDYIGDRLLGLDGESRNPLSKEFWQDWSWGEFTQNVILGYFLGTIFNGISGGEEYDADRIRAVADEAIEAAQSGLTFDEIEQIAIDSTKDQVVIKPGKHEAGGETAQQIAAAADTENLNDQSTRDLAGIAPEAPSPDTTGTDMTAEEIVNEWNEQQGAEVPTPTEPNAETTRRVQQILEAADAEHRGLAPGEINQILQDPAALNAYANETGVSARQARADLESRLNGDTDTTGSVAQNAQYEEAGTTWDKFWNAANQGPDALIRLIAEDPANMEEYMRIFQNATGETMSSAPEILRDQLTQLANDTGNYNPGENPSDMNGNPEGGPAGTGQQENGGANPNPFFPNENQSQNGQNPNPNGTAANNDTSAPGTGREKVSRFFTNSLTGREGADVRSPLSYLTKTEAETLQNAMNRLSMNGEAELETLTASTMWSDEQVKMGKIIGQNLLNEARSTGDWSAYDAWRKVEREHATAIARALRAYGRDPEAEMTAEGIAKMAANYFSMLRDGVYDDVDVDLPTIDAVQQAVTDTTNLLGEIEAEEADLRNQGFSEEEIAERTKDRYLDIAQDIITKQYGGFLADDLLGNNAKVRDGVQNATTILRGMLAQEDPEYIRNYVYAVVAGIPTDIKYMGKPTAKQRAQQVSSLQKLCQLFGTGTTGRNLLGNTTFGIFNWASNNTAGALADSVLSLFTGQRSRGMEKGAFSGQNWGAALKAARRSALEIAANLDMKEDGKYINGPSSFSKYDPGGRFLAKTNQILSYALNTTDSFFVGMGEASASEAAMRANENRGGAMTEETAQQIGENEAMYSTFKNSTQVQKVLEATRNFFDLIGWGGEVSNFQGTNIPSGRKGGFGLGTAIVPYIGVPVNLGLKVAEFSPLGAAKGAVDAVKAVRMARNANSDTAVQDALVMQNKASGEIGRGVFGTAVVLGLKALMKKAKEEGQEWFKDWNLVEDSAVKSQNRAEGKSGQQVNRSMLMRIVNGEPAGGWQQDDELVNLSAVEPLNQVLALASLLADDEHASGPDDYLKALGTATLDSLEDLPAISSLTQIADTVNYNKVYRTSYEEDEEGNLVENREVDPVKTGVNAALSAAGNAASGFIPAPIRHVAQVRDEYQRDTRGDNAAETALNQIINSIPGARETLPVKTDAFGNPVTQGDRETRIKNTYGPLKHTQVNQTPVSEEINRLYDETGVSLMPSASGPKTITYGSGDGKRTVELSADESRAVKDSKGQDYQKRFDQMRQDPVYNLVDDDTKVLMGKELEKLENDTVKADVAKKNGIAFDSRYEDVLKLDDPTGYLEVNTAFKASSKDEKFKGDVIDALIPEIGKMSIQDRQYLRDKNSTAMNYYDYLTPNAHGYKVGSADTVHDYKQTVKENAEKRGVTSASGGDKFNAVYNGYYSKEYSPNDVLALMTKQASDGDYDVTKGRAAVFLAAYSGGKSISEALQLAKAADIDNDGTVDEKGYYKKAEKEGSKTLKKGGVDKTGMDVFYDIMYPNKK